MAALRFRKAAEEIGKPTAWRDINSDRMSTELTEVAVEIRAHNSSMQIEISLRHLAELTDWIALAAENAERSLALVSESRDLLERLEALVPQKGAPEAAARRAVDTSWE